MRRSLYVSLLVIGVVAGAPWAVTQAVWSDSAEIAGNTFSTGTVDISTNPTSALLTLSTMAPGSVVTGEVTVTNGGTLDLRYAISTGTTGSSALADGLTARIKSGVTTCTTGGFGASGTSLYSGALSSAAVGDPTTGAQTGDRDVSASGSEALCFQVELPSNASSSLQGTSTTATFTFAAEQTA